MAEFQNTIDLLGDEAVTKALVERTITEFNDNIITKVGNRAFQYAKQLTSIDLPLVTEMGGYAFGNCPNLVSINLPSYRSVVVGGSTTSGHFQYCEKLKSVTLPNLTSVASQMFQRCYALETLDLYKATRIQSDSITYCGALKYLVLRSETLCAISSASAVNGTPFASVKAGGTLLAPRALVTEYPTATNWSSIMSGNANNRVLAL
jgi:hypothetical protein